MAVKTKTRRKSTPKPAPAPKATNGDQAKRFKENVKAARKLEVEGKSVSEIAAKLGTTSGRAAYFLMVAEVTRNKKLKITGDNDEAVLKQVKAERLAAGDKSGWGWLSARTGIPEGRLKKMAEEYGVKVKGTNAASMRKAKQPAKAKGKGNPRAKA